MYRAIWIDGYIVKWDIKNQNWERKYPNTFVALKSLNNSKNVTLEFINEVVVYKLIYLIKFEFIKTFFILS